LQWQQPSCVPGLLQVHIGSNLCYGLAC